MAAEHRSEEPAADSPSVGGFAVSLSNFQGPFDVLLHLIASKEMDVTQVALAEVTDEFLAFTFRLAEGEGDDARSQEQRLDERTGFLVVAATLLDLKAARLLPQGEVESLEDVEALEARDLLFAKLLQYKAFKQAAQSMGERLADQARSFPRDVRRGEGFDGLEPRLEFTATPELLARLAQAAFEQVKPPAPTGVGVEHLHGSSVTVAGEAEELSRRLVSAGRLTFTDLTDDAESRLVLVVRFLALLELYRRQLVLLEQEEQVIWARWTGPAELQEGPILEEGDDD